MTKTSVLSIKDEVLKQHIYIHDVLDYLNDLYIIIDNVNFTPYIDYIVGQSYYVKDVISDVPTLLTLVRKTCVFKRYKYSYRLVFQNIVYNEVTNKTHKINYVVKDTDISTKVKFTND